MDIMADTGALLWDTLHSSVWLNVIRQLPMKERFVVSLVCKSWHAHALSLCQKELSITLVSSRSCRGLGVWLRRHGALLSTLHITDNFYQHVNVPGATRIRLVDRLAMLHGLHGNGQLLQLQSLSLCLDELSATDAAVLGLCHCPALTYLKLDSNGANIGMTGAQALAPLSQLRHLIVPTQSLGDQGLQIISSSMPHLQHINLHNDGHVADDGLLALQHLTSLTSLDLQGSISITNRGMAGLAEHVPQLLEVNISWCAGATHVAPDVGDWGLGQLCSLTGLTSLNIAATGIHLQAPTVLEALSQLGQLAVLKMDRCGIHEPQLKALAAALPSLRELHLSHNPLASFSELRVLSALAHLTHLDVSHPVGLRFPDNDLAAVFALTQLHSLNASCIMPRTVGKWQSMQLLQKPVHAVCTAADVSTVPAGHTTSASQQISNSSTDNAGRVSFDGSMGMGDFWQKLCFNLGLMPHLSQLNFQGNIICVHQGELLHTTFDVDEPARECAVLLNALAAAQGQPTVRQLCLSVKVLGVHGPWQPFIHLGDAAVREVHQRLLLRVGTLLARYRCTQATGPQQVPWDGDDSAVDTRDLTASDAAAVIKRALPSLRVLKLQLSTFENCEDVGVIKWPY